MRQRLRSTYYYKDNKHHQLGIDRWKSKTDISYLISLVDEEDQVHFEKEIEFEGGIERKTYEQALQHYYELKKGLTEKSKEVKEEIEIENFEELRNDSKLDDFTDNKRNRRKNDKKAGNKG